MTAFRQSAIMELEKLEQLRSKVIQAEQERIAGEPTLSVSEARKRLGERVSEI